MMVDLVLIQARRTGTNWSARDTIPFESTISLSSIALGACIARLCLCFGKRRRWSQLGICIVSIVLSLFIIGLISSRRSSDQKLGNVYFGILISNCICSGLYEIEFVWSILDHPITRRTLLSVGITLCLIVLGLAAWAYMRGGEFLFATVVFLAVMCLFYVVASGTYSYLLFRVKEYHVSIFQAGCICSFLLFIYTIVLLPLIWKGLCSEDLGLWILYSASTISTVRFPLWIWRKRLHTLFSYRGPNEQHPVFGSTLVAVNSGNQRGPESDGGGLQSSWEDLERQNSMGPLIAS